MPPELLQFIAASHQAIAHKQVQDGSVFSVATGGANPAQGRKVHDQTRRNDLVQLLRLGQTAQSLEPQVAQGHTGG